jgi:hypothetical protein
VDVGVLGLVLVESLGAVGGDLAETGSLGLALALLARFAGLALGFGFGHRRWTRVGDGRVRIASRRQITRGRARASRIGIAGLTASGSQVSRAGEAGTAPWRSCGKRRPASELPSVGGGAPFVGNDGSWVGLGRSGDYGIVTSSGTMKEWNIGIHYPSSIDRIHMYTTSHTCSHTRNTHATAQCLL